MTCSQACASPTTSGRAMSASVVEEGRVLITGLFYGDQDYEGILGDAD